MSQATPTIRELAEAERERRRRTRLRSWPGYGDWLPRASPSMNWGYAWLRHLYPIYDAVTAGLIRKLIILAPPQHGKSESGTIRYPVYRIERDPRTRVIVGAHSQALANRFSRRSKAVAQGRVALSPERRAMSEWETPQGGGMKAVGVGTAVAGAPADLFFIDDPVRNQAAAKSLTQRDALWDWFCEEAQTRVQDGGAIVIQMNRRHEDDLVGRILTSEDAPNWTVVRLPALAEADDPMGRAEGEALCPERFSRETLLNRELTMRLRFAGLYQQRPTAAEGGLFKAEWFQLAEQGPKEEEIVARCRYWDFAATEGDGDWTVGCRTAKTREGNWYVEHVHRGRWGPTERDRQVKLTADADPPGTKQVAEQEPGASGVTVAQDFVRRLAGHTASTVRSVGDKELRAEPWASQLGAGTVRVVRDKPAKRWNHSFIREHVEFPNGSHDDQVDAASGAFSKLTAKRQSKAS